MPFWSMVDAIFDDPRLAGLYDFLDSDRSDLHHYLGLARAFGARHVLDIGCGTGTFACLLARHGIHVIGIDPAAASLDVARKKPFSEKVTWILGDANAAVAAEVDLVTMTGNVAQVFLSDDAWSATLRSAGACLKPDGRLVFEVRDPDREGWRVWTRDHTYRVLDLPGVGELETWIQLVDVARPFVTFRHHFVFHADGTSMVSESTLRFRSRAEIAASLLGANFVVEEIRDAPDRPGMELVFVARHSA
jgi:SAM-dependent methyltransferase